ncbi:YdeI/OmpD-associated family protein [Halalkalibacter oceani]|uniref:DUF1801 domain-containing protein n=1 Tax=Halalkalibacter oceani TaxID=1653776 RepID=A0A9X2DQ41_9BACI|nr:DUF1801 domain-containing protein [Halalkalibacter oceani]MCM3714423.1 DUF1801 domain-containing protein [Halalkalibacter oceani]
MANSERNPKVDDYLRKADKWKTEMEKLRAIVLTCPVEEEVKWGKPCYTVAGKNICIIQPFKEYVALMFFKGALLPDPHGVLIQMTENVQAARQLRFTSLGEIVEAESILKAYVHEAVEVEKAGLNVPAEKKELALPEELQHKFAELPELQTAFEALTPGRQRAYVLYFTGAKQAKTRVARVEKYVKKILDGKGLNE